MKFHFEYAQYLCTFVKRTLAYFNIYTWFVSVWPSSLFQETKKISDDDVVEWYRLCQLRGDWNICVTRSNF
jgi:hypothetical protein